MRSLRQILRQYGPVLLLDAASTRVSVGWIHPDGSARWAESEAEAGTGLFQSLRDLGVKPDEAGAFVFCEGPGSILGIRTAATILRTWNALRERPTWCYRSLELVAAAEPAPGRTVICDARRQSWHVLIPDISNPPGRLTRIATAELSAGNLITPAGFRQWSTGPAAPPVVVPYEPARLTRDLMDAELLRAAPQPDAYLPEDPSYVTWSPQVHRAPPISPAP